MSLRIAIVGGGLAGLSLAAWLHRRGQACTVYEASERDALHPGEVHLSPAGVALLRELVEVPDAALLPVLPLRLVSHSARSLMALDDAHGPLAQQQRLSRAQAQAWLLSTLPSSAVHFGARVTQVIRQGDTVRLGFADGTSCTADLVIGADGAGSTVRRSLWEDAPKFLEVVAIDGVTAPGEPLPLGVSGALRVLGDGCSLLAQQALPQGPIRWQFSRKGLQTDLAGFTPSQLRDEVAFLTSEWALDVRPLLERTDDPDLTTSALMGQELPTQISLGAVTLVGEAAHSAPRLMDLGAAQALYETRTLAELLEGATPATLASRQAHYEQSVRKALDGDVTRALWNVTFFHLTGPFARFLRDSGMRLLESGMRPSDLKTLPRD